MIAPEAGPGEKKLSSRPMKRPNHAPDAAPEAITRPQVSRPITRSTSIRSTPTIVTSRDGEVGVGQVVDGALRLFVLGVGPDGPSGGRRRQVGQAGRRTCGPAERGGHGVSLREFH